MSSYADAEPLLTDHRLSEIEEKVRKKYKLPDHTLFFTAIVQPPEPDGLECHFVLQTEHPYVKGFPLRDIARVQYTTWLLEEDIGSFRLEHGFDLALGAFYMAAKQHKRNYNQLKATMN